MRTGSLAVAAKMGVMILLAHGVAAEAAEIKVLCGAAFRGAINELGPQFERTTGHKLVMKFDASGALKRQIDAGETFDVAILNPPHIDDLAKQGKIASGTRADVARAGVGAAVRKGAAKPDIGSVDAFKRTLLNAKSVSYSAEGASGAHFTAVLERLGIAAEMKPKIKALPSPANAEAVAKGEVEMVVLNIGSILAVPGVDLVGPVPSELQSYIGMTGGVAAAAKEAEAAKALMKFLMAADADSVIKAKGLERVKP